MLPNDQRLIDLSIIEKQEFEDDDDNEGNVLADEDIQVHQVADTNRDFKKKSTYNSQDKSNGRSPDALEELPNVIVEDVSKSQIELHM